MSTERDVTRIVRSWLDEGVTKLPDRVLDAVLDQVPATPQRRSWWPAWRSNRMNTYAKLIAAAAAIAVVAVVGYQLLPRNGGVGGQPTTVPSPSPTLLARGSFQFNGDYTVDLDATGGGSSASGSLVVSNVTDGGYTVDLECTRTIDGLLWIGGDVTQSTNGNAPTGTRAAIVFKPASPVKTILVWQMDAPPSASCQAFFDDMNTEAGQLSEDELGSILGTVQFGP